MPDPAVLGLEALKARICRVFPAQVRTAVDTLDDDQLWWRPNETSNSVGNLVLHLAGSLNHYLNRNLGGFEYNRDRAHESASRRHQVAAVSRVRPSGVVVAEHYPEGVGWLSPPIHASVTCCWPG